MAARTTWRRVVLATAVLAVAALPGCAGDDRARMAATAGTPPVSQPATGTAPVTGTPPAPQPSAAGLVVKAATSDYGEMLFDQSGQAMYLFDLETGGVPQCYDACADEWPPVLTDGSPVATGAVRAELLAVTPRTDGTRQVSYAGHPLYYYVNEGKNEVLCHNVTSFGGVWRVVTPSGAAA